MKNKVTTLLGGSLLVAFMILFAATITGTIIYFIYPVVIPGMFNWLIVSGYLPAVLPWWTAVCFSWLWGILLGRTSVNKNQE